MTQLLRKPFAARQITATLATISARPTRSVEPPKGSPPKPAQQKTATRESDGFKKAVRQTREHTNYFSTIIRVDSSFKQTTLAHNNQTLTDLSHPKLRNLQQVLKKADSWYEHM